MRLEQLGHETEDLRSELLELLSQQEHPLLFKPFYFLHPCKTADWMKSTEVFECEVKTNYTLKWLSFVFFALNVDFDFKFAIQ